MAANCNELLLRRGAINELAHAVDREIDPGLERVVLWRRLISFSHDIPNSDIDLLAFAAACSCGMIFMPLCNFYCLKPCAKFMHRQVPSMASASFRPSNLTTWPSLRGRSVYRSGPTFWQRYTSFWFRSLADRVLFSVVPILVASFLSWVRRARCRRLHVRRIDRLHGLWVSWNTIMPTGAAGTTHRAVDDDCRNQFSRGGARGGNPVRSRFASVSGSSAMAQEDISGTATWPPP